MVNDATINIIIGVITLAISVSASMFISGTRWGKVQSSLEDIEKDRVRKSDIASLHERLSRIERMFTLTFKHREK